MTRRPLAVLPSLHGVLLGRVPPLQRYYEDAKPSCHPFRRTSCPSLGDFGILSNDADVDGDLLSAALVLASANGTLVMNADGSFLYAPDVTFSGTDSFTYAANDGSLVSNVATVTITVARINHAPVATDDNYGTAEDTSVKVVLSGVLTNDSDVDGDSLSVVPLAGPAHGSLTLKANTPTRQVVSDTKDLGGRHPWQTLTRTP